MTYRDALMSRGDRLAFPVWGSRFRPPLRYLGHSSSKSRNQNQNETQKQIQIQVYRGRRVDEAREEKQSCWCGSRCWRSSACPLLIRTMWRLKHTVFGPQSKNGRLQQKHQVCEKASFPLSIPRRTEAGPKRVATDLTPSTTQEEDHPCAAASSERGQ